MKFYLTKHFKSIIAIALMTTFHLNGLGSKILDPDNYNVFFRRIAYSLDTNGIDIVQDWNSNVQLEGRPTLAPIANYRVSVLNRQDEWTNAFSTLYANAIVALDTNQPIIKNTFMSKWQAAPIEKRVFISFTKDDLHPAERIKMSLEEEGYKVFLYTESNRAPFTSPAMIVDCMKTAGEVLVLDTENSRNKVGVIAEALAFAKYTYKPEKQIVTENELLKQQVRETVSKTKLISPTADEMIDNTIKLYKEQMGITYLREEIVNKMQESYGIGMEEFFTNELSEKGKEEYINYLLDDEKLTPYSYNKKLTTNISYFKENPVIKISKFESVLNFISYFGFCPYYKIPIRLCPICSKGL